jgi:hypothetical protein
MSARSLSILACAASLLLSAAARADCFAPAPLLYWSYPAEGAQDVPVDAELWVLSNLASSGARPEVSLNGRKLDLAPAAKSHIDQSDLQINPGVLAANTPYTLELHYLARAGVPEHVFEVHFTTGAGRAAASPQPKVVAHSADPMERARAAACASLFAVQDCFDTITDPPAQLHSFELARSPALAWFVRSQRTRRSNGGMPWPAGAGHSSGGLLWPASCGDPRLVVLESQPDECFELQAIAPGGKLSAPVQYCASPKPGKAPSGKLKETALSPREPTRVLQPEPKPSAATQPETTAPAPSAPEPSAATTSRETPTAGGCSVTHNGACPWWMLAACALLPLRLRHRLRARSADAGLSAKERGAADRQAARVARR